LTHTCVATSYLLYFEHITLFIIDASTVVGWLEVVGLRLKWKSPKYPPAILNFQTFLVMRHTHTHTHTHDTQR
jgi:hypothetical protein